MFPIFFVKVLWFLLLALNSPYYDFLSFTCVNITNVRNLKRIRISTFECKISMIFIHSNRSNTSLYYFEAVLLRDEIVLHWFFLATVMVLTSYQMKIILYIHSALCWHYYNKIEKLKQYKFLLKHFLLGKKDCNRSNEESTMVLKDLFHILRIIFKPVIIKCYYCFLDINLYIAW